MSTTTRLPRAASTRVSAATAGAGVQTRSGLLVRAGDLPVLLTRPTGGTVAAAVLSQSRAQAVGVNGAVFTVTGMTPGGVGLDYSTFADAGGAGYGARLRLVALPACSLTTPEEAGCLKRTLLPSVNDAVNQRVTVTLTAEQITELADPGVQALRPANTTLNTAAAAGMLVLAAEPDAASSVGDFAATQLAPSGSWSTTGGTGAFTWSYPIETPASTAGGAPSVGLSYNSQTVDGLESNTNNQSSWVGQGFALGEGFIERTYLPCAEVPDVNPARVNKETADQVGDRCWAGEIVTFSLGGATTALVLNDDPGDTIPGEEWHPENDNGETVEHIVEEDTAGAVLKESWKITTVDGTQYTFGLDSLPGRTTQPLTNSVFTMPIYGANPGDRCYSATSLAASKCTHDLGWRWNLDSVTDTNGNVTAYYYNKDTNFYEGVNGRDQYIRGGYLDRIEYGMRLSTGPSVYSNQSTQQVLFTSENRCLGIVAAQLPDDPDSSIDCTDPNAFDGNDPTDTDDVDHSAHWPDTPLDLKCDATGYCGTNSPTFWSAKRLATITTGYRTTSATAFTPVDQYDLTHEYSYNDTGEMTLTSITRIGQVDGVIDDDTELPPVEFGYVTKPNRVLGVNDEPQMQFSRLNRVVSETGSVNYVKYGQPAAQTCAANDMPEPEANDRLCYPVLKTNPYNWGKFTDWFNKYVVLSVRTDTGQDTRTADHLTTYLYGDTNGDGVSDQGVYWHYDDNEVVKPADRLFAQFRGYRHLTTITGDQDRTRSEFPDKLVRNHTVYYVGIELNVTTTAGDTFIDEDWLAGSVLETRSYNGAATAANLLSTQINSYTVVDTTGTRERAWPDPNPADADPDPEWDLESRIVRADKTTTITQYVNTPNVGKRTIDYDYNPIGLTTQTIDTAGIATSILAAPTNANSLTMACTMYNYGTDPANRIRDRVAETITTENSPGSACPAPGGPVTDADVRSRTRVYFDGSTTLGEVGARGNATMTRTAVNEPGTGYEWATTGASYDVLGRTVSSTGYSDSATPSTARTTTTAYTPAGPGPITALTVTNALGQQANQTLEPGRAQVLTATNTAGETTEVTYDALGRTTVVSAPAQDGDPTVKYSYLIDQDILAVTTETLVDTPSAAPAFTKSVMISDLLGQVIQTQTDAEGGGGNRLISDTYYNSHGQPIAEFRPWYTAGPPTTAVQNNSNVDNLSTRALTNYDDAGRPVRTRMYEGRVLQSTTSTVYSGNKVTTFPPPGGTPTATIFDARGNTAIRRDYTTIPTVSGSTVTGGLYRETDYTYDALNRLTRMRDLGPEPTGTDPRPVYATWEYGFDVAGRQTHQSDADAGESSTVFNDAGETITTTDARGVDMHYSYDKLGRKVEEHDDSNTVTAQWTWDTDRVGSISSTRRIAGGNNYDTTYSGYNNQGLPSTTTTAIPAAETGLNGTYASNMTWTSTGLLATSTLPSLTAPNTTGGTRETITHNYSALGRATSQVGLNTYAADTVYDPYGQVSQITLGNDARTAWLSMQREPHTQRLAQISLHTRTYNPTVASLAYEYDQYGNVTKTVDTQGDGPTAPVQTTCYDNDRLGQLSMAWSANDNCAATPTGTSRAMVQGPQPFWHKYTYDAKGNRTKLQNLAPAGISGALDHVTDYTYAISGHAHALSKTSAYLANTPSAKTDANYTYDDAGSVTERTGATAGKKITATYYDNGRTETLNTPDSGTTTYIYDADGNILIRRDPVNVDVSPTAASQVRTAYIGQDQYRVVAGTPGITTTRQYTHAGITIGQRVGNASISWMFADANNTTNISVGTTPGGSIGTITRRYFDPFGATLSPTTNGPWLDKNTFLNTPINTYNFVDMGARLYDPTLGRFTTVDPILTPYNPRQNNGYNYAWNNPLANSDPSGLAPEDGDPNHKYTDYDFKPTVAVPTADHTLTITYMQDGEGGSRTLVDIPDGMLAAAAPSEECTACDVAMTIAEIAPVSGTLISGKRCIGDGVLLECPGAIPLIGSVWKGGSKLFRWLFKHGDDVLPAAKTGKTLAGNIVCVAGNSFVGETWILLASGEKKFIRDIVAGDEVWASDPSTGSSGPRPVTSLIAHTGSSIIVTLILSDGSQIDVTDGHLIWVSSQGKFTEAGQIRPGDTLLTPLGLPIAVRESVRRTETITVYNLSIADIRTYFVGSTSIVVHNTCRRPAVVRSGDIDLPGVPEGAIGTLVKTGKGYEYPLQPGSAVLDRRVTRIRVMDPVTEGQFLHPTGYAVYMNAAGQTVDPFTGRTILRTNPLSHIDFPE